MPKELRGSGQTLGVITLGDVLEIHIEDDSHPDPDVTVQVYFEGKAVNIERGFGEYRYKHGDDTVVNAIAALDGDDDGITESYESIHSKPFVCDDCHRTWPSKYLPDTGEELCPDCR